MTTATNRTTLPTTPTRNREPRDSPSIAEKESGSRRIIKLTTDNAHGGTIDAGAMVAVARIGWFRSNRGRAQWGGRCFGVSYPTTLSIKSISICRNRLTADGFGHGNAESLVGETLRVEEEPCEVV